MPKRILFLIVVMSFILNANEIYFLDAHSQIDEKADGLGEIIKRMDENNVKTTFLTTRGKMDTNEIINWNSEYPNKIIPFIRVKGKDYIDNIQNFYRKFDLQANSKEYKGISEILLYHAQKGDKAPEVRVKLSDERFLHILKIGLEYNWPIILHIEFASLKESERKEYMDSMELLLTKYPTHPFALIHMGQLEENDVAELLKKYDNLYFITSHSDPITVLNSNQPWINLFDGYKFKDTWKALFIKYPTKFVFALDNVWAEHWKNKYNQTMEYWTRSMNELDEKTANLIAHKNAERLWHLK